MDAVLGEIKVGSGNSKAAPSSSLSSAHSSNQEPVGAIKWTLLEPGILSIAIGSSIQDYDTKSGSRPALVRVNHAKEGSRIRDFALYPQRQASDSEEKEGHQLIDKLYSRRMLTVLEDRNVCDMAKHTYAPVAISHRDGRIAHSLGASLFVGSRESGKHDCEQRFRVSYLAMI
jgi:hypothetical protein